VGDRFIPLDHPGKPPVERRLAHPPQRGLHRRNQQVGLARRQPPKRNRAVFGNFRMRRTIFVRQYVVRGKTRHASSRFPGDRAVKPAQRLDKRFGALIRLDQINRGTPQFGQRQRNEQRLRRIGQPREANLASQPAQLVAGLFNSRPARDPREKLGNEREYHARISRMRSIRRAVE